MGSSEEQILREVLGYIKNVILTNFMANNNTTVRDPLRILEYTGYLNMINHTRK